MKDTLKSNKSILLIAVGIVVLFIVLLITVVLSLSGSSKSTKQSIQVSPTPKIEINNQVIPTPNINVVSTQPTNNSSNVALNTSITLTLNQAINPDTLTVTSNPTTTFSTITSGTTVTITPSSPLFAATIYTLTIKFAPEVPGYIFAFRTVGSKSGDTFDFPHQRADLADIKYHPDTFLARRMPMSTKDYQASTFLSDISGYFEFNVKITGTDKATSQQEFLDWIRSQGLTDTQIKTLIIHYL